MNKKMKLRVELDAALKSRTLTADDCQTCKQHFYSPLSRESHFKLYPSHNPFLDKGCTEKTGMEKK